MPNTIFKTTCTHHIGGEATLGYRKCILAVTFVAGEEKVSCRLLLQLSENILLKKFMVLFGKGKNKRNIKFGHKKLIMILKTDQILLFFIKIDIFT